MKRSRAIALATMGVSALALQACSEAKSDAAIYQNVRDCIVAGDLPKEQCERAFGLAVQQHAKVAPKYKSKEECEADMGVGKCETAPYKTQAGGSIFMPLMAGYLMGRALGGATSSVAPQPLYRSRDDGKNFRTADNKAVGGRTGLVSVPKSAGARPSTKLFTASRGGFGASGRSYGSRSGG